MVDSRCDFTDVEVAYAVKQQESVLTSQAGSSVDSGSCSKEVENFFMATRIESQILESFDQQPRYLDVWEPYGTTCHVYSCPGADLFEDEV